MDELCKLESTDTALSRRVATRLQARLKASRDPALLGDIVEFYFKTFSKRARKVLISLKEAHSQDFFDKLNDSIEKTSTRLPVLKLLAHLLKSSQTNWLYRIVDHPLFTSILKHIKTSGDVVVLSNALFVVSAILPMVPSYIGHHLQELFSIFCELATIKGTNRLGLTPKELYLHLEVAVYYFFLQLYALFPCNLFQYLRSHYGGHSSGNEITAFQEWIAPLFAQVQLHPSLVTDGSAYELSKAKWGSMEPHDIATLSLQLCLDTSMEERVLPGSRISDDHIPSKSCDPLSVAPLSINAISESSTPQAIPRHLHTSLIASNPQPSRTALQTTATVPSNLTSTEVPACVQVLSDLPEPAGLKSAAELSQFWSPSQTLGHIVPSRGGDSTSHSSGYTSLNPPSRPSLQPSNLSTPISDSTMSSAQHTPGPNSSTNAFNYSPTASLDGEMAHSRGITQSAIHSAAFFEDSHITSTNMDPLSQSVMVAPRSGDSISPATSLHATREQSFKKKLGRFIGLLTQKGKGEAPNADEDDVTTEGFTEIFVSDVEKERLKTQQQKQRQAAVGVPVSVEEVGEECFATSPVQMAASLGRSARGQGSPEEDQEEVKSKRNSSQQDDEILKISDLPISTRTTRTNSESSTTHDTQEEFPEAVPSSDNRLPLMIGSYQNDGPTETLCSRYSASYPERSPTLKRTRTSKSETNATQTVMMVQERLQRLVEASESGHNSLLSSSGSTTVKSVEQSGDKFVSSGEEDPLVATERPKLGTFVSVDSTKTLRVPSPSNEPTATTSGGGVKHSQSGSTGAPSESAMAGSRMFIRRVSVCSPRQPDQHVESHNDNMFVAPTDLNPSPVVLLDQFVARGEILHRGNFESIPLTELEGVDWNHFGGCPHSEEFGMMRSQVALLHSQLLFERHQCLQHARRNRRLLSRARMASQITEELLSLRDQLRQQNLLLASQTQQQRNMSRFGVSKTEEKLQSENKCLGVENTRLKDSNIRLREEVRTLKQQTAKLSEELKHTNEKMFSLENEMLHLQPRLKRGEQLQAEVDSLTRELQVLGELYHQQRDEIQDAAGQWKREQEWKTMCDTLQREKECVEKKSTLLFHKLSVSQARVAELETDIETKNKELTSLHDKLRMIQGQYKAKMKALGDKYFSVKLIGQQLETHIMEMRGQAGSSHKKRHSSSQHRRSSSHPAAPLTDSHITPSQFTH